MRILHTSDWHLGKSIHGQDLIEDQRHVLGSLIEELSCGYDVVIIAGDIYDRAIPPSEAVGLFSWFVERMVEMRIKVVIIPGNHDSPARLDFASGILERSGIHFRCRYDRIGEPIAIEDGDGNLVHIHVLPFVDEVVVREMFPDHGIRSHQDATEFLLGIIREKIVPGIPSILVAHTYTGMTSLRSDSERELLVGGQGLVESDLFNGFDHVALGHLHRPQVVSRTDNIYYSGSLIPYSFSETDQRKGSLRLDLDGDHFEVKDIHFDLKREFSIIEGDLKDLLTDERFSGFRDHYLSVKLTDKGLLVDIHKQLLERFPHILEIDQPALHIEPEGPDSISRKDADDPLRLFTLFLERFKWDEGKERAIEIFKEIRTDLERKEVRS